jgi:hypothetical protein
MAFWKLVAVKLAVKCPAMRRTNVITYSKTLDFWLPGAGLEPETSAGPRGHSNGRGDRPHYR